MPEMLKFSCPIEFKKSADEKGPPTFEMTAYTGAIMNLNRWDGGVIVDLAGMKIGAKKKPIFLEHENKIVGHSTEIKVDNGQLYASGLISGTGDAAKEVLGNGLNGFPWQASIGAMADKIVKLEEGKTANVNGRDITGPATIIRKSTLKEISFVALGADENTSAEIAATLFQEESNMGDKKEELAVNPPAEIDAAKVVGEVQAKIKAAAIEETKRISAIQAAAKGNADLTVKALDEDWSVEKVQVEVLKAETETLKASLKAAPQVSVGEPALNGKTILAAACKSVGIKSERLEKDSDIGPEAVKAASDLRGLGLRGICEMVIRAAGKRVPVVFGDETLRVAREADRQLKASGLSTTSLTGICGAVANKALLAGYEAVPSVIRSIAKESDAQNFQTRTSYRLKDDGGFALVAPGGDIHSGELTEDTYTNKLNTYGKIITLDRQMIMNDDLNAFADLPRRLGKAAADQLEYQGFYALLDEAGNSFWHANHRNLSASSALAIAGLNSATKLFMEQVDAASGAAGGAVAKAGHPINVIPRFMLAPPALAATAKQLYVSENLIDGSSSAAQGQRNIYAGAYTPLSSPYLSNQNFSNYSDTTWFLLAGPDLAVIEVLYLRGIRAPTIESSDAEFETLGTKFRAYFDFAVAQMDWRGGVKATA